MMYEAEIQEVNPLECDGDVVVTVRMPDGSERDMRGVSAMVMVDAGDEVQIAFGGTYTAEDMVRYSESCDRSLEQVARDNGTLGQYTAMKIMSMVEDALGEEGDDDE